MNHRADAPPSPLPEPTGIVSVNTRGGASTSLAAKVAFMGLAIGLLSVGAFSGYSRYRSSEAAMDMTSPSATDDKKHAVAKPRKFFAADPAPLQPLGFTQTSPETISPCTDGEPARLLTGPGGQTIPDSAGKPLQVCKNGQLVLSPHEPMLGGQFPVAPANAPRSAPESTPPKPSRFGGDVALGSADSQAFVKQHPDSGGEQTIAAMRQTDNRAVFNANVGSPAGAFTASRHDEGPANQHGSLGPLLASARSSAVSASFIGDRDMIVPEGRSIDCNLSMRVVTEVSGKASCVLSSNVYSDSGRVVLAERGSTVTGEYTALAAQGQRRIFVLWTRLQTPKGVVIDINSPAADALGTSGLPGDVDNRWRARIGAAVLLSLVEDAIGYQTAKASAAGAGTGVQGIAVLENSTQTGRSLAERILDSTINIKPTVYKRQGDRATIYVSRDLDFGGVYALRAK